MSNKSFLFAAIIVALFLAFYGFFGKSYEESAEMEEISFDDGFKTNADGEIIIEEKDFAGTRESAPSSVDVPRETTETEADGSVINTMFDRYGNRTDKRAFTSHSRLAFVLLRTTQDGKKEIFVYSQSGEVKRLSEDMSEKVLTTSADEIANLAGIQHIKRQNSTPVQNIPSVNPISTPALPNTPTPSVETKTMEGEKQSNEQKSQAPEAKFQSNHSSLQKEINLANLPSKFTKTKNAGSSD